MRNKHSAISIVLAVIGLCINAAAQNETVTVETNLVTLNVTVADRSGNYIRGLRKEDFTVLDGRARQEIETFSTQDAPVSFGIVYDLHPSTDERTESVLAALKDFTKGLRAQDNFFVSVFNERGSLTTDFVPTPDHLRSFIGQGSSGTPNSLYDAIFAASAKLSGMTNAKRILLVLTDGSDHFSRHSLKDLRLHLRSVNLPLYSITFSSEDRRQFSYADIHRNGPRQTFDINESSALDRNMIAEISKTSGGQSFENSVRNRYYLAALCKKVIDEVKNQYVVGFYPEKLDGKWHKLAVTVKSPTAKKYRITARKGYQSPKRG